MAEIVERKPRDIAKDIAKRIFRQENAALIVVLIAEIAGFSVISKGLTTQTDTIKQLTQDLSKQLPESLGELEKTLVGLTRQFGKDYESFLEKVRNLMAT